MTLNCVSCGTNLESDVKTKFLYLGGALISTAILITLLSMILVLLAIEHNKNLANTQLRQEGQS